MWNARKIFCQTPSQEFVTLFSKNAHTVTWTWKRTGVLPHFQMQPSHVLPLDAEREENFQPLISRNFILPFTSSNRDNDRLQIWFSPDLPMCETQGTGQPLRRERETIRQTASDELENHHTFSRLVLTPYRTRGKQEDYSLVFTSHDPADCATGTSLDFHNIIPGVCRDDVIALLGTSLDHMAGLFSFTSVFSHFSDVPD